MSNYERINCSCGRSYVSKDFMSSCPGCGKTNWSTNGGLIMIAIVVGIALFLGLILGSLAWALASISNQWSKWNYAGAIVVCAVSFYFFNDVFAYDEYPIMSWIAYISNGIGGLLGILGIFNGVTSAEETPTE